MLTHVGRHTDFIIQHGGDLRDRAIGAEQIFLPFQHQRMRFLELINTLTPQGSGHTRRDGIERGQRLADIGTHRQHRVLDFADLAMVDVDVDNFRLGAEGLDLTRGAVIEAHAQTNQNVALFQHVVGVARAVHTQHTQ